MVAKPKQVVDVKGEENKPEEPKADPNRIEYNRDVRGNLDLVVLRMLNTINNNLVNLLKLLKEVHKDKLPKEDKTNG